MHVKGGRWHGICCVTFVQLHQQRHDGSAPVVGVVVVVVVVAAAPSISVLSRVVSWIVCVVASVCGWL